MNTDIIKENLRRGTIELLILSLLKEEEDYAYRLRKKLAERSNGTYEMKEATLYPTLYRLTQNGYIEGRKVVSDNAKPRTYYHLTDAGLLYLDALTREYLHMIASIEQMLHLGSTSQPLP